MASVRWRGWACVTAGVALATACAARGGDKGEGTPQEVNGARPSTLGAIVSIEGGCTAAKVGPKHLLVAARCVTNKPAFAIGKALRFRKGNVTIDKSDAPVDAGGDVAASAASRPEADAASDAAAAADPTD